MPIGDTGVQMKKAASRVKGVDGKWLVLGFGGTPDMKEAIDDAIEQYPGAVALSDGVIKKRSWYAILLDKTQYIVESTPVYTTNLSPNIYQQPLVEGNVQDASDAQARAPEQNVFRLEHVVKSGETLRYIAQLYGTSAWKIILLNNLQSNEFKRGQKLLIEIPQN